MNTSDLELPSLTVCSSNPGGVCAPGAEALLVEFHRGRAVLGDRVDGEHTLDPDFALALIHNRFFDVRVEVWYSDEHLLEGGDEVGLVGVSCVLLVLH